MRVQHVIEWVCIAIELAIVFAAIGATAWRLY
jgi:hypothetical protein